jgi:hypothetical protein
MSSTVTESLRGEACSFTNIGLHCSDYEAEDHEPASWRQVTSSLYLKVHRRLVWVAAVRPRTVEVSKRNP